MSGRADLAWVGSSKKDFDKFPDDVQDVMGFALDTVQCGETPQIAKPLKGVGGGVWELVDDYNSDTYRVIYAVQIGDVVYVLHAFQKKSKSGIATPLKDINLVKDRLKILKSKLKNQ